MQKAVICLLVATLFLMPITAVKDGTITSGENKVKIDSPPAPNAVCNGGDEPEITDAEGDTLFDYIDVLWASFYEDPNESDYLYIELKIANLKDRIGCVYAIHWYYNGTHYVAGLRNGILIPLKIFKQWFCAHYEGRRPVNNTWNNSLCDGYFDLEDSIIRWKIHKSCIGDPKPGDALTNSYVFTAQRISAMGFIPFGRLFASFSDATPDGKDYIVQY